jgi:hypothetical protein
MAISNLNLSFQPFFKLARICLSFSFNFVSNASKSALSILSILSFSTSAIAFFASTPKAESSSLSSLLESTSFTLARVEATESFFSIAT